MFIKALQLLAAVGAIASVVSGGYALIEYGGKIAYYENRELKANLEKEHKENVTLRSEVERLEGLKQDLQQALDVLQRTCSQPDKEEVQNRDTATTKCRKGHHCY